MGNKIQLGDVAQDAITGFQGVVTGHCRYITGCDQFLIQPQIKPEAGDSSKFPEARWFDENRLRVVETHTAASWRTDDPSATEADGGADVPAPIK